MNSLNLKKFTKSPASGRREKAYYTPLSSGFVYGKKVIRDKNTVGYLISKIPLINFAL